MKWKTKCLLCLLPFFTGLMFFYIIPFGKIMYYSMIENQFGKKFVWLNNYTDVLSNQYFLLALKNSVLVIIICVPVMILAAIIIAHLITGSKYMYILSFAFILPLVIPTASAVPIWKEIFHSTDSVLPVYLLFIYKNIGTSIVLISAAMRTIPAEIYEAARLDGADGQQLFRCITMPCSAPAIIFSALIGIVGSFRIYKESYLYYGTNYPPPHSYTLQYYMNNNFLKLDFQALSCGAMINMLIILAITLFMLTLQRKYSC